MIIVHDHHKQMYPDVHQCIAIILNVMIHEKIKHLDINPTVTKRKMH